MDLPRAETPFTAFANSVAPVDNSAISGGNEGEGAIESNTDITVNGNCAHHTEGADAELQDACDIDELGKGMQNPMTILVLETCY